MPLVGTRKLGVAGQVTSPGRSSALVILVIVSFKAELPLLRVDSCRNAEPSWALMTISTPLVLMTGSWKGLANHRLGIPP